jgi:prolyl oligopeptidase PreP (S9A serine peptidase family)
MATETVTRAWLTGGISGKEQLEKQVTVALSSEGADAVDMPASLFDLTRIEDVQSIAHVSGASGEAVHAYALSTDGSSVFVYNLEQGTDANRIKPVDITATLIFTIKGYK